MKTTSLIAIAAAATAFAGAANAADLGGNCCADLEERIAELEATTARKGNRKVSLTVSGQVGESILFWDDGAESNVYVGSHDYARTRFRFIGNAKINDDWSAGYHLEVGVRTARNNRLTQNSDESQALDLRFSNWYLQSKRLGKVTVGQGSQATDGITEVNLANTAGLGFVQLPDLFASGGAGFLFRSSNGALPGAAWGLLWPASGASGQIGEGDRWNVVRYDTPTLMGFVFSASWGEDDLWDVALRYAGEFNGVKLAAAVGYAQYSDGNATAVERGCAFSGAAPDVDCSHLGMSISAMHVPTGLYVAASYGRKKDDNLQTLVATGDDTYEMYYVQAGLERKFNDLGKTTIFADYHKYDLGTGITNGGALANFGGFIDGAGAAIAGNRLAGADVDSFGIGIVQNIEAAAMDLYLYYSHIEADLNINATGGAGATTRAAIEDFDLVLMGAVIKF